MVQTKQVFFSGRVQGVGFRWTTQKIAANFPVTGYVRNLSDGRVELIVQGQPADVDAIIESVKQKMAANIVNADVHDANGSEVFGVFEIRR